MIKLSELREAVDAPPHDTESLWLISDVMCDLLAIYDELPHERRGPIDALLRDAGIEVDE